MPFFHFKIIEFQIRNALHFSILHKISETMKSISCTLVGHHYIYLIVWCLSSFEYYMRFKPQLIRLHQIFIRFSFYFIELFFFIYFSLFLNKQNEMKWNESKPSEDRMREEYWDGLSILIGFLLEFDMLLNWFIFHLIRAKVLRTRARLNKQNTSKSKWKWIKNPFRWICIAAAQSTANTPLRVEVRRSLILCYLENGFQNKE